MVLIPVLDLATNVWPIRASDLGWRYGAVGLLSGFLLTPVLGLVMATGLAGLLGQPRFLRVLGTLSLVGGIVLLGLTGLFTLDVVQLRGQVPAEGETAYWTGAIRAWIKNLVVVACLVWIWAGARTSAREMAQPDEG